MTPREIVHAVARARGITVERMCSQYRPASLVRIRHEAMWLLRHTGMSTPNIARAVGRKDHTTVLNGLRKMARAIKARPAYADEMRAMVGA